jgi:hypothetical protein
MSPYPPQFPPQHPPQFPPQFGVPPPRQKQPNTGKTIFTILIPAIWSIALICPAYSDKTFGVTCFALGWTMLFTNILAFLAWLANIPFVVAYFMFAVTRRKTTLLVAMILSVFAFIFSFGAFTVSEIMENEGGGKSPVGVYYGTFVWMSSLLLLVIGTTLRYVLYKEETPYRQVVQQHNPYYRQFPQQPYPPQYPPPNYQQQYPPQQNPYGQYPPDQNEK